MLRRAVVRAVVVVLAAKLAFAAPVEGPLETVVFEEGDTLRGVAERYLKDADLWPQILELSGVGSPSDLRPGTELLVPVIQVAAADEALAVSLVAIQKATAEGARLFAPEEIGSAIENRDTAVERRDLGAWAEVVTYSGIATDLAGKALAISLAQRDRAAEAMITDAQGSVEGRAPDQPGWSPRVAKEVLVEAERLRTLSASTAQVTFRDLSRLRLNPNSNAIIQRMRSDPLTGAETTSVSLVNGDFYALLNQLGNRAAFEVDVPGVETETQSSDFWVKHEGGELRFANYDAPALEITRGDETISLGENEGAVVPVAGAAQRADVLARVELGEPFDGEQLYDPAVTLGWEPAPDAEAYWLEVAADAGFNAMQASEWGVRGTSRTVEGLAPGDHYWRVSSLDRLGLPGVRSLSRRFRVVDDRTPPFVTLSEPQENEVVTAAAVEVAGESEPGARLTVNGGYVPLGDSGDFLTSVTATPGPNTITVAVVDPAGNRTERTRSFVFSPVSAVTITLDPATPRDAEGRLLTRTDEIDVAGTSDAAEGAGIRVLGPDAAPAVQALVGPGGSFHVTLPASDAGDEWRLEVAGPDGQAAGAATFVARPRRRGAGDRARRAAAGRDGERLARAGRERRGRGVGRGERRRGPAGRRALRRRADPGAGNERDRDRRHRRGGERGGQAGRDGLRHRPARDNRGDRRPAGGERRADRDRRAGDGRLGAATGGAVRADGGRHRAARLPALRRRRRDLPRDAAAGAGGAGARGGGSRGLRRQRGEAAALGPLGGERCDLLLRPRYSQSVWRPPPSGSRRR